MMNSDYEDDDDQNDESGRKSMELSSSGSDSDDTATKGGDADEFAKYHIEENADETNAFKKPKIDAKENPTTGMTEFLIQDETFTLMQPLVMSYLQKDNRIMFAGYRPTHCLDTEIMLSIRCVDDCLESAEDCLRDALQNMLKDLETVEASVLAGLCDVK